MPQRDDRARLEAAGASGVLLDILLVPRETHAAELTDFEVWAASVAAGEDPREAAESLRSEEP